jgi:hypothetical protein
MVNGSFLVNRFDGQVKRLKRARNGYKYLGGERSATMGLRNSRQHTRRPELYDKAGGSKTVADFND